MSLSAEYACWVGLKPYPAVKLRWFPGKRTRPRIIIIRAKKRGCVHTFSQRERGEYVRPPSVAPPPHRIPAFSTHLNLGMSARSRATANVSSPHPSPSRGKEGLVTLVDFLGIFKSCEIHTFTKMRMRRRISKAIRPPLKNFLPTPLLFKLFPPCPYS